MYIYTHRCQNDDSLEFVSVITLWNIILAHSFAPFQHLHSTSSEGVFVFDPFCHTSRSFALSFSSFFLEVEQVVFVLLLRPKGNRKMRIFETDLFSSCRDFFLGGWILEKEKASVTDLEFRLQRRMFVFIEI